MGLESVELVMEWEEAFGIDIPDEAASRWTTPRLATEYLLSRLERRSATECIRQRIFFRLRRGFRRALGQTVTRFEPQAKLCSCVARRDWPQVWARVRQAVPDESWPERAPFRGPIEFRIRTLGDLVQELARCDPRAEPAPGMGWTREQVSLAVRRAVDEVVGARYFDEDDEFVTELGIR